MRQRTIKQGILIGGVLYASLCGGPAAYADAQREAELFGGKRPQAGDHAKTQAQKEAELFAAKAPSPAPTSLLVDKLQVGGRLELGVRSTQMENQPWREASLSSLSQADVYFDARPNEHIRAFVRGRLSESTGAVPGGGASSGTTASASGATSSLAQELDEAWFRWDYGRRVFFTLGKQHLKWGSGRIWNPSDFMAAQKRDPFALTDRRLGVEQLKVHLPFEKGGQNLYLVLQHAGASRNDDLSLGLRAELPFLGLGEMSLSLGAGRKRPLRLALDLSTALGPFDVIVEAVASKKNSQSFYRGKFDASTLSLPSAYRQDDKWLGQVVLGSYKSWRYGHDDTFTLGFEYFYNQLGYDDRALELYALFMGEAQNLYAGRSYVATYAQLPTPGSWQDTSYYLYALHNLSDKTSSVRLTQTWEVHKQARLELFVSRCFGDYGELCFRIPEGLAAVGQNALDLPPAAKAKLAALPSKRSPFGAGVSMQMDF